LLNYIYILPHLVYVLFIV